MLVKSRTNVKMCSRWQNQTERGTLHIPAMKMHKQLSRQWHSLVLWTFHKWVWSSHDRIVLQPVRSPILYQKWEWEKRVRLVCISFNKKRNEKRKVINLSFIFQTSLTLFSILFFFIPFTLGSSKAQQADTWCLCNHFIARSTLSTNKAANTFPYESLEILFNVVGVQCTGGIPRDTFHDDLRIITLFYSTQLLQPAGRTSGKFEKMHECQLNNSNIRESPMYSPI